MKISRCLWGGQIYLATVDEEGQTASLTGEPLAPDANPLHDVIAAKGQLSALSAKPVKSVSLSEVTWLSPFSRLDRNPFAVGKNYHDHALEFDKSGFNATSNAASAIPAFPQIFTKATTSLIGPGDAIRFDPAYTTSVDYEGELAVVIGERCRNVSRAHAMEKVFGFVLLNDVTARDLQKDHAQWFLGKSLDTFCPLGPWIATPDSIDIDSLRLQTWVNGELRQDATISQLIFDIPTLIETLTRGTTLLPGDIIATGTPVGVGIGFKPPKFLRDGDVVRIAAPGLGELVNPVQGVAS